MTNSSPGIRNIIIGGSAGSFENVLKIISSLPKSYPHNIFLILHRLRQSIGNFVNVLDAKSKIPVVEPYDKEKITKNKIYIAPENYHLYFTASNNFMLSTEELVQFARPSMDISFTSAAKIFRSSLTGILLSGANYDGIAGLKEIVKNGGTAIVHNPRECRIPYTSLKAIDEIEKSHIKTIAEITNYLLNL